MSVKGASETGLHPKAELQRNITYGPNWGLMLALMVNVVVWLTVLIGLLT